MREIFYLLFHLITTLAKLIRRGGRRTVIAENLLLKQQLIIHSGSRQRTPNLSTQDRALLGFWSGTRQGCCTQNSRLSLQVRSQQPRPFLANYYRPFKEQHPFVERLIGSIRRELLDQTLFWTATDLENKLQDYQCYYNECRKHFGLNGATPVDLGAGKVVDITNYQWKKHCRGLFELPVAA